MKLSVVATMMVVLASATVRAQPATPPPDPVQAVIAGAAETLGAEGPPSWQRRDIRRRRATGIGATIGTVLSMGLIIGSAYAIGGPEVDFGARVSLPRNGLIVGLSLSPILSSLGAHLGNRQVHGASGYHYSLLGSFAGTALGAGAYALAALSDNVALKILTAFVAFPTFQVIGAFLGSFLSHRSRMRANASRWTPSLAVVPSGAVVSLTWGPSF